MDREMLQKILEKDTTLSHYGIKGQEWGKRRFQNEDGTLTLEGRKRYGLKTEYSEMSDQELRDAINKKRTQNQYVDLRTEGVRKKRAEREGLIRAIISTGNTAVQLGTTGSDLRSKKTIDKNKRMIDDSSTPSKKKQLLGEDNVSLEESLAINKKIRDVTKKISDATSSQAEKISKVSTKGELSKAIKDAKEAVAELDEKELRKTVDRMLLEKQYDELINPPKPSRTARGREVIQSMGALMSITLTGILIAEGIKNFVTHSDEDSDYLVHYDVKSIKKGIRHWTNEDGTIAEEGKRHRGIDPNGRQAINQNVDAIAGRRLLRNKALKKSTVSGAAKMASAGRELFPLIVGPR